MDPDETAWGGMPGGGQWNSSAVEKTAVALKKAKSVNGVSSQVDDEAVEIETDGNKLLQQRNLNHVVPGESLRNKVPLLKANSLARQQLVLVLIIKWTMRLSRSRRTGTSFFNSASGRRLSLAMMRTRTSCLDSSPILSH
jgi:hypothetical protein